MQHLDKVLNGYLDDPQATADQLWYAYQHYHYLPVQQYQVIQERLARNPSCPSRLLAQLVPQVCPAALQNPAWEVYRKDEDFLRSLPSNFILRLLSDESAPQLLMEALTLHPSTRIVSAARRHVSIVGEVTEGWERAVRDDWVTQLRRDSALVWLQRAGGLAEGINAAFPYPITPLPLLPEPQRLPILLEIAKQSGPRLAPILAISQLVHAPTELRGYYNHPHWERRFAVALNPQAPRDVRVLLTHDGHQWVRAAARVADFKSFLKAMG
ncbi:hypothetical protein [Armatimonas rosea]|uniref:Uncharacterized protein n=1 Tax=Armatimonas rosea TaxID=685828 RepID=A0A7W9SVK0_ARMRO|nr:hypothetical protein [Armatimonas rosea]MBB6053647.1 hypothetical protein [Armatimonas rosea]